MNIFQTANLHEIRKEMKMQIQYRHHQPSDSFADLVEHELHALNACQRIDEARVLIERQPRANPPFRILLHLITSGPGLTEEAHDHTLRAAFTKLILRVRKQIGPRAPLPRRSRRQVSAVAGQWSGTPTSTQ